MAEYGKALTCKNINKELFSYIELLKKHLAD